MTLSVLRQASHGDAVKKLQQLLNKTATPSPFLPCMLNLAWMKLCEPVR
ncbi:hypothetical protein P886_3760 [Alteromonadaceae bacterium 2753L.S.0a.02]|nr:hypothetical protein P886_3760 [Alteromonadaceae bacterium 2753L.S.0a.02]